MRVYPAGSNPHGIKARQKRPGPCSNEFVSGDRKLVRPFGQSEITFNDRAYRVDCCEFAYGGSGWRVFGYCHIINGDGHKSLPFGTWADIEAAP